LRDKNIKKLYASDTLRTMQTAEIINKVAGFGLKIQPDERLREFGTGTLEGVGKQDDLQEFYKEREKYGLESLESVFDRARSFLNSIHTTDDIIIVCHGGIMHMFDYVYLESEFSLKRFNELFKLINPKGYSNSEILQLDFGIPQHKRGITDLSPTSGTRLFPEI
jgi:broad specificity phosphatase PhoE